MTASLHCQAAERAATTVAQLSPYPGKLKRLMAKHAQRTIAGELVEGLAPRGLAQDTMALLLWSEALEHGGEPDPLPYSGVAGRP